MIGWSGRDVARSLALAAAYAASAIVALRLGATLHDTPPLWPAAGVAVAALCIGGLRLWPGIAIGTIVAIAPRGNGLTLTTAIVLSTTLEAVAAAWLLRYAFNFCVELRRARDAVALVLAGGVIGPAIGATVGAGAFALVQPGTAAAFGHEWLDWFLGEAMGAIVFAPVVLAWARKDRHGGPRRVVETIAFGIGLAFSTAVALGAVRLGPDDRPLIFVSFPFIVWGALRLGMTTTTTAIAIIAFASGVAASIHLGVFALPAADAGALLQAYLATAAATALIVAASSTERRDAILRVEQDVGERMRGAAALRESEARLAMVFNSTSDTLLLFAVEAEGRYRLVMANRAYREDLRRHLPEHGDREITGLLLSELITQILGLTSARVAANEELFARAIAGRVPLTYENADWNRPELVSEVSLVPVFDESGTCTHVLRSSRDITARKAAQDALRLHDFVVTHAPVGVLMLDGDHRIVFANETACAVFGRGRDEMVGAEIGDLDAPNASMQWRSLLEDARTRGKQATEVEHVSANGTRVPLELNIAFLDYAGQEISCVFVRDISERRKAEVTRRTLEAELFQAQKMEAVGTLAGGIAHDFNNILAAIVGNAEMAQIDLPQSHPGKQDLAEVLRAARRARDLVRQILTFSRKQEAERRPVRTAEVIDDVLKLLRATIPSTIELRSNVVDADALVFGDPTQLHQVLMNLCTNAAHAVGDQHGSIEVAQTEVTIAPDSLRTDLAPGRYVRVSVTDTGHGMDRATLERVFEPFFTTKSPGVGTGLGLAVVHGIMRNHDGVAHVESAPGVGTVFRLYFPRLTSAESARPTDSQDVPLGRGERVLFVDDEPQITNITRRTLERLGYRVVALGSATDALRTFRADPSAFDVVISDLTMPGLTGAQLAVEMRRLRANLPVILSTGYLDRLDAETARDLHVRELLIKPYTTEALANAVRRALREAAA
jgi:PAS domain S-box-containing protein